MNDTPLDLEPLPADTPPVADTPPKVDKSRGKVHKPTGRPPGRPRKDAAPAAEPKAAGRPSKAAQRERQYTRSLAKVGALWYLVNAADGTAFLEGVPNVAKALAAVAEQNPRVAKVLDAGASAGVWIELASAIGAIGVPVLCNHGVLPPYMAALLNGDASAFLAGQAPAEPPAATFEAVPAPAPVDPPAPDSFVVA